MTPELLAREISKFVNSSDDKNIHRLAQELTADHPTLQQRKMVLVCSFIQKMSEKSPDGRNEASVQKAKRLVQANQNEFKTRLLSQGCSLERAEEYSKDLHLTSELPLI